MSPKYHQYRQIARSGDIIFTSSKKPIAFLIRLFSRSKKWHHSELTDWWRNRLLGFGSHPEGTDPAFLSVRFKKKEWDDFTILRPDNTIEEINYAFEKVAERTEEFNKYDYGYIGNALLNFFGIKNKLGSEFKNACVETTNLYCLLLGHDLDIKYPEDHLKYIDKGFKIII